MEMMLNKIVPEVSNTIIILVCVAEITFFLLNVFSIYYTLNSFIFFMIFYF